MSGTTESIHNVPYDPSYQSSYETPYFDTTTDYYHFLKPKHFHVHHTQNYFLAGTPIQHMSGACGGASGGGSCGSSGTCGASSGVGASSGTCGTSSGITSSGIGSTGTTGLGTTGTENPAAGATITSGGLAATKLAPSHPLGYHRDKVKSVFGKLRGKISDKKAAHGQSS
ncbi:hypothetical protein BDV96DRAFT_646446 [Lophiotrema nucula]|uniref:Uncharacterized protein n=1 Tax=Lophiotrema nucula TaxID=690887 RepID=A0A6A5Z7R1_9PLEO|nr:hypothetical protein BDV96DRAFT_646446 [Lophiotrema nucula]